MIAVLVFVVALAFSLAAFLSSMALGQATIGDKPTVNATSIFYINAFLQCAAALSWTTLGYQVAI